ncbi:MAG: TonB-dependent receptor [Nitrospiraceae bacterium]|nr:MAG: TonB-dependent receptor [Nitrospiraceae bacterium]
MYIILLTLLFIFTSIPITFAEDQPVKLGQIVVTATRYGEELSSVPSNITVISGDDITRSTAQNIPDILRSEAGVLVNDIGGNRRNMTVDIRGFGETAGSNTLVLVDGRRVNQPDLSGTDWSQIPLDRVARIEIIRSGRGSILYGDNAAGGVINIITKEENKLKAGGALAAGSYDTYKGNAYFSNSTKALSYSLNGSYLQSDGYRDNSDTNAKDLGLNLSYYPNNTLRINFSSGYHKDNTGLPGGLKDSDFTAGKSRTDTVNPRDFAEVEDYYFKGGPEVYFLNDSLAKIDFSYRRRASLSFSSFTGGNFTGDTEIRTIAVSPQALLKNAFGNVKNTLTFGADIQDAKEEIENNSSFSGIQAVTLEKESVGYYVHDEVRMTDAFAISGGYRHDRADFDFRSNLPALPGSPDHTDMDEDVLTAGLNYAYYGKSYAYLSYSQSFRYPVLDELFNFITNTIDTTLMPQRSENYEIGLRHYFTETFYGHVNFFRIDTDREIVYDPGIGFFGANNNLKGGTRRDGVELSISVQPLNWLQVSGDYTYTDARLKGGKYDGSAFPNVPHNRASVTASADLGKGISVVLNGVFVGERPFISDFDNEFRNQEDYTVINGKIKYRWKYLTAYLDVNNIFDEEYSEFGTLSLFSFPVEKAFYPSPGRNFLAGLAIDF